MGSLLGNFEIRDYYYATIGNNSNFYAVNGIYKTLPIIYSTYNDRLTSAIVPSTMNAYLADFGGGVELQLISTTISALQFKYVDTETNAYTINCASELLTNGTQISRIKKYNSKPMTEASYLMPSETVVVNNLDISPTIIYQLFGGNMYVGSDSRRNFNGNYVYRPDYYMPPFSYISNSSWMVYFLLGGIQPLQNPITYIPINSILSGPESAGAGEEVTVDVSFPDGYKLKNATQGSGISVRDQNGYVDFTYNETTRQIKFTMPSPE